MSPAFAGKSPSNAIAWSTPRSLTRCKRGHPRAHNHVAHPDEWEKSGTVASSFPCLGGSKESRVLVFPSARPIGRSERAPSRDASLPKAFPLYVEPRIGPYRPTRSRRSR